MNLIKQLIETVKTAFRIPSADEIAIRELEEARRQLLAMQSAKDYATRMVEYNMDRVRRLTAYVAKSMEQ